MKTPALCAAIAAAIVSTPIAYAAGTALPETISVVAEFPVGGADNALGVEQPPEDAAVAPMSIAVLPGQGVVILDNVNQRLAIHPQTGGPLTTFAKIDESVAPGDVAVRQGDVFVLDSGRARILLAAPGKIVGPEAILESRDISGRRAKAFGAFVGLSNDRRVKSKLLNSSQILQETGIDVTMTAELADQLAVFGASRINLGEEAVKTKRGYTLVVLKPQGQGPLASTTLKASAILVEPLDHEPADVAVVGAWIVRQSADGGQVDVRVQELDTSSPVVFVQSSIRRYTLDGNGGAQLASVALLAPVEAGQLAAAADGEFAYQLRPVVNDQGKVETVQLLRSKFGRVDCNAAFDPLVCIPANNWPKLSSNLDRDAQKAAKRKSEAYCRTQPPGGDARAVLENMLGYGQKYVDLKWTMNSATANAPDKCDRTRRGWSPASQIRGKPDGTPMIGVPYAWGGFDSPNSFAKAVNNGRRAGNSCTGNDNPDASFYAGLDCSSFVQRIYGLARDDSSFEIPALAVEGKLTTKSFQAYVLALPKFVTIVPGDIFLNVNPGDRHVLAFVTLRNGEIGTIESTKYCAYGRRGAGGGAYQGVCFNRRSLDALNGYVATRSVTNCQQPKS